jgi:aspartyl-tRNA(Asn)/glutamyl-tRNA(Gln) amidotransferase subunit A
MNLPGVVETAEAVRTGLLSAESAVVRCLERIQAHNARLNAFVFIDAGAALARAREIDVAISRGEDPGPLAGVPFGIKDLNQACAGMPCRNGSLFHANDPPQPHDSTFIARLRGAGAIPLGKVATAEFGMDGVTHTLAHGTTRNPWSLDRTPSGSSGGSSAAVSAGLVPFCTSSDGGGSTRCPAGYTGTVGLKPSHGRIPRADGFSERSCLGVITATVRDTARILDVAAGPDDHDRTSLPAGDTRYEEAIASLDVRGLNVAWSADLGFAPVAPEVELLTRQAALRLIEAAQLRPVATAVNFTNVYMAANMNMTRRFAEQLEHDGILPDREAELSPGPRWFLQRSRQYSDRQLYEARAKEKRLEQEVAEFFAAADVLLSPCHAVPAYCAEGPLPERIAGMDASETHAEPFTMLANIGWNPSISVPAGLTAESLPVGLLITVRRHRDDIALRLARIFEQVSPWPRHPPGW